MIDVDEGHAARCIRVGEVLATPLALTPTLSQREREFVRRPLPLGEGGGEGNA